MAKKKIKLEEVKPAEVKGLLRDVPLENPVELTSVTRFSADHILRTSYDPESKAVVLEDVPAGLKSEFTLGQSSGSGGTALIWADDSGFYDENYENKLTYQNLHSIYQQNSGHVLVKLGGTSVSGYVPVYALEANEGQYLIYAVYPYAVDPEHDTFYFTVLGVSIYEDETESISRTDYLVNVTNITVD